MVWPSIRTEERPETAALPPELLGRIDAIVKRYPHKRAALLPALHECQAHFGYISDETGLALAEHLELAPSHVADTVSFYSMLRTRPVGRYHVEICQTLSCALLEADHLADYLVEKLGIGFGEVTADGKFSLGKVECIGACEQAPVMLVNNELYGHLNRKRIDEILDKCE